MVDKEGDEGEIVVGAPIFSAIARDGIDDPLDRLCMPRSIDQTPDHNTAVSS